MKVLMLPWGDDVNVCLSELLMQLKTMPQLTKLGLNRWSLTDVEVKVLGKYNYCRRMKDGQKQNKNKYW